MKTAIVYYSKHHGNTEKLLKEIAAGHDDVTLIDVTSKPDADVTGYDRVGFASGIYYSKFHKSVLNFARERLPEGCKTFYLYTCGADKKGYTDAISAAVAAHHGQELGAFGCLGFDSYGPFKLIGGIAKGHPDDNDLQNAVKFYEGL